MINIALLIVALSGNMIYELELPNMEECMKARTQIEQQNTNYDTVCVPAKDNSTIAFEWIDRLYPPKCGISAFEDAENEMRDWEWRKKLRD